MSITLIKEDTGTSVYECVCVRVSCVRACVGLGVCMFVCACLGVSVVGIRLGTHAKVD